MMTANKIEVYRDKNYVGNSSFTAVVNGHLFGLKVYEISPFVKFEWKCKHESCQAAFQTVDEYDGSIITQVEVSQHNHKASQKAISMLQASSVLHRQRVDPELHPSNPNLQSPAIMLKTKEEFKRLPTCEDDSLSKKFRNDTEGSATYDENAMPLAQKLITYKRDQRSLFAFLETEEERHDEYDLSKERWHYLADIGDLVEAKKPAATYQFLRKSGFGNFSLAWLAQETKKDKKCFRALKIFKSNVPQSAVEFSILKRVKNHDHIVQLIRSFDITSGSCTHKCAVFEPLGSTLLSFLRRFNKSSRNRIGLTIPAIKKVAIHILKGLQYLHESLKLVHTDIKPENIMSTVSERSLYLAVQNVISKEGKVRGMRPVPNENKPVNKKVLDNLLKVINDIPPPSSTQPAPLEDTRDTVSEEMLWNDVNFKIIDLGSATVSDVIRKAVGTPEYRPPENVFGAPIYYSVDTWSVGATIAEMLMNEQLFMIHDTVNLSNDLLDAINELLGYIPADLYMNYPNFNTFRTYTANNYHPPSKCHSRLRELLASSYYSKKEIDDVVEFLLFVFNFDPIKRPSAKECLSHPWLQNV